MGTDRADTIDQIAAILCGRQIDHPLRVGIDGITASGKSTFADELADAVTERGRPVARVTMDGFHHHRAHRHRQGRLSADGYYDDAYDLTRAAAELLAPLGPGGSLRYRDRVIDLATDEPVESWDAAAADTVLIVDGSFLQRPEIAPYWDEVIYLQVEFPVAFDRGVAREAEALGGKDAAALAFTERYHAAGRRYVREIDPGRRASIVVDNDRIDRPRLIRAPATA